MKSGGRLIAVDSVSGAAALAAAKELRADLRKGAGVSQWDASGVFGDLYCDGHNRPSPRVLLLLYATDLAFRLRWEIQPLLAEGRVVIAASYVDTAIAFGRAAGLRGSWLTNLFGFAPVAAESHRIAPAKAASGRDGFIEFGCDRMASARKGLSQHRMMERASAFLKKKDGHRILHILRTP